MSIYYQDDHVTLYHGDMCDVLQDLADQADAVVTDPPYGETTLPWDRWPKSWPLILTWHTRSMWCFGSFRMFTERWADFASTGWKLSQDVVWEKQAGSGFSADRFKRVHEHALHFYQGAWSDVYHEAVRVVGSFGHQGGGVKDRLGPAHAGRINPGSWEDDGTRLQRSVLRVRNCHGRSIHPTEKPGGILAPLIEYSVPPGGLVLDPFAGSASTLLTARSLGRRAIGIEANEEYCERAAERLSIPDLFTGEAS